MTSIQVHLPTEVLLVIGLFLDGPSLLNSILVCRYWHLTFHSLLWSSISERQWHHRSFPIHPCINAEDLAVLPQLFLLRHIHWVDNQIFSSQKQNKKISVRRQMSDSKLAWLLQHASNLVSLSLNRFPSKPGSILLKAIEDLSHLRKLHIHVPFYVKSLSIKVMFPLFSRLEELKLTGTGVDSYISDPSQLSNIGEEMKWRLKSLTCRQQDVPLVQFCPDLTFFEIPYIETFPICHSSSLRPLQGCPKLETVSLPYFSSTFVFADVAEGLRTLKSLRWLALNIYSREDIEFLCAPDRYAFKVQQQSIKTGATTLACVPDQELSVPLLEHLQIGSIKCKSSYADIFQMIHNILVTRVKLKSFLSIEGTIDPSNVFAQPGREIHDSWGCRGLETLYISFPKPMYVKTREEQWEYWGPIYRQIGQLSKLKSLEINCTCFPKEAKSGILQLAGAANLERLAMSNSETTEWTKEETQALAKMLPKLKHLRIACLPTIQYRQIKTWLHEAGRPDIDFKKTII